MKKGVTIKNIIFILLLIVSLTILGCAGKNGYWNKENFNPEQLQADYRECNDIAHRRYRASDTMNYGVLVPYVGIFAMIASEEVRHVANRTVRKCMEAKGYVWKEE